MAKGFRKSKLAFWGIMCLGVLLSVLLWIRDRNYPVYIPIIASTLSLLIGYFAACVVRNLIANSLTTQYLGYLHMELDPDKFIAAYGSVPGRLTPRLSGRRLWSEGGFYRGPLPVGEGL